MREDKLRAGKLPVDAELVRRLVAGQFPQWAGFPVRPVALDGWDNWTFRLGDHLKVRLPTAEDYVGQVEKEARWLPVLAPRLPLAVPVPVGIGEPAEGYPWSWSVYEWIEGEPVTRADDRVALARGVADFINALQRIEPMGGPAPGQHSLLRGAPPIEAYGADARRYIDALAGRIDARAAHRVLDSAASATWTVPKWAHGDIAVGNLLTRNGDLCAILDFGSSAVGDPSCDLAFAWVFLEGESRRVFRAAVETDEGTWARARAWALWKAALLAAQHAVVHAEENLPLEVIASVIEDLRERA